MANEYTIKNSRGTTLTTINAGARDLTTSLVLQGRGQLEYGLDRNQNLVYLLENFSTPGSPAPRNPIEGQLWWNTQGDRVAELFVFKTTGSPATLEWSTVVPPPLSFGFDIVAGAGLINGGFPTLSPLQTTLDVGEGTGITVNADDVQTNDSEIDHDALSGFVANEHIDHSLVIIDAAAGVTWGSPNDTGDATTQFVDLTNSRVLNIIDTGDGITVNADDIEVDSTVMRTAGTQSIGGRKFANKQLRGTPSNAPSAPAYSFSADTNTGLLRVSSNVLGFVVNGDQKFQITNKLTSNTAAYETLVTEDDDIPNKKYVDDVTINAFTNPTDNNFQSQSGASSGATLTGLDGAQTYLVGAYGIYPFKGTGGGFILDQIAARAGTSLGSGAVLAFTPQSTINWFDGHAPAFANLIVPMAGNVSMHVQINRSSTGAVNRFAFFLTAVQLTNN